MKSNAEADIAVGNVVPLDEPQNHSGAERAHVQVVGRNGPSPQLASALRRITPLLWLTVIIPTALSGIYFGFLAEDVYVSESRFVVRNPDKPQKTGLGVLLGGAGFNNASEEVRAAQGFIESRDALRALNVRNFARRSWGSAEVSIFNRFDPLGWSGSFEELYKFYRGKVDVAFDPDTAITTLTVRAFDPNDAQAMNARLLARAEALVNDLNERGSGNLVKYAEREVAESREQASQAALDLASYRNRSGVIDPERQAEVQMEMISKLQDELIGARMQLLQLTTASAQNPQIPLLKVRIRGLEGEIEDQLGRIAGDRGSLSAAAAEYQRLQVQRAFADQQLALSLAALQEARNESRRQHAYLETVAQPSLPDAALEPRRLRGFVATLLLGLVSWGILSMLLAGVREHQD